MIPWVMWIAGVAGYLILVCEAMVAVPLWMLAHLTFEGDGLHGRGLAGYELLFNILFRPVLMLIGLFLGYFIFTCISWLIRMSFGIAAAFVLGDGWLVTNWLGLFVLLSIFVLSHVVAAIASFRMITLIPHHIPRMIGFSSANRVDMDEFSRGAALIGANETLSTVRKGLSPKQLTSEAWKRRRTERPKVVRVGCEEVATTNPLHDKLREWTLPCKPTTDMGGGLREPEDE